MSSFALKLLAMASMLIDNAAARFAADIPPSVYILCRTAGRLAMPVFCFLIAEGLYHSRDMRKYLMRLSVFALVSEIPFDLFLTGQFYDWSRQNVGFTLLLGLMGILLFDSFIAQGRTLAALLSIVAAALMAALLRADYQIYGVYYIFVFYRFRGRYKPMAAAFAAGVLCMALSLWINSGLLDWKGALTSVAATGALLPIRLYSGKRGPGGRAAKWLPYAFYPLHMLALYALWTV